MLALNRDLLHPELHRGPPKGRVPEHVALGGRVTPADQADHGGQKRQRPLAFGSEQAFRRERPAQPFQPGEQLADPDGADLHGAEREGAAGGIEVRLRPDDHPRAFGWRRVSGLENCSRADDADGDGRDRVAEREVHGAAALAELGDLSLDPDPPETAYPVTDQPQDRPDRDRGGGAVLQWHGGKSGRGAAGQPWPVSSLLMRRSNIDRKSTRLNSSHLVISYAVFCLKKK